MPPPAAWAGIANHGTMTIAGTRITGNTAANDSSGNAGFGGGIVNQGGTVMLTGTQVAGNVPDNCEPPGTIAGCAG